MYIRTRRSLHRPSTEVGVEGLSCTLAPAQCRNFEREHFKKKGVFTIQSTPDNSNLQKKSKKVRVIGRSKKISGSKKKNSFNCTVNILITFNCRNVK